MDWNADRTLTDFEEHLLRVDGLLLALEQQLEAGEGAAASFSLEDVAPPPERRRDPPGDRFTWLVKRFGLEPLEADLLRMALAAELSTSIASTFARLQGDRRFRRPQVALSLRLIEPDPGRRPALIAALHEEMPLRRHQLLELVPPWRDRQPLMGELELAVPAALLYQLAGVREVDPQWAHAMQLYSPRDPGERLWLSDSARLQLERLSQLPVELKNRPLGLGPVAASDLLLYLFGPYGSGRRSFAQGLARAWRLSVLEVDLRRIPEELLVAGLLRQVRREALRLDALPVFLHVDRLYLPRPGEDERPVDPLRLEGFLIELQDFAGPIALSAERSPPPHAGWYRRGLVCVELQIPPREEDRLQLWRQALLEADIVADSATLEALTRQFPFSAGQMADAARAAISRSLSRGDAPPSPTLEDLRKGSTAQLRHNLENLSHRSRSAFQWDDLVLPDPIKTQLSMFEGFIRNRSRVYEDWGLGRRLAGRGLKALFFGASGTGKTMAASVIANRLGIDLFKVDMSSLVSKWVGETEKNLDKVFTEAQKSHAIILFDEADALFGKRGSVERGTDRYSNMEINYLLQRFEEYDGVVILTSNFPRGIDEAFSRRMHFMIEFPTPDQEMRRRLWRQIIPPELPLSPSVDLERLVKQFELTGGNIQNVVLGAALIAADRGGELILLDFMRAIQWEYQKVGKSSTRSEFQEFFDLLQ